MEKVRARGAVHLQRMYQAAARNQYEFGLMKSGVELQDAPAGVQERYADLYGEDAAAQWNRTARLLRGEPVEELGGKRVGWKAALTARRVPMNWTDWRDGSEWEIKAIMGETPYTLRFFSHDGAIHRLVVDPDVGSRLSELSDAELAELLDKARSLPGGSR